MRNLTYLDKISKSNFFKWDTKADKDTANKPANKLYNTGNVQQLQNTKISNPPNEINNFIPSNTPTFLMNKETKIDNSIKIPVTTNLKKENQFTQNTQIPQNPQIPQTTQITNPISNNNKVYEGLEAKVESITQKLNNLETRVEKDEKINDENRSDIKDLKSNLNSNFNKLDNILEKLIIKLK